MLKSMPKIQVNNISIYYQIQGCDRAPYVIFNNGILMNAASAWQPQVEMLSNHYRVLKYDFRGQGDSDRPEEQYSMERHADDLAELMSALEIDRAHMVGLSYGGTVALAFALKYPQLCSSLVLAGTASEIGERLKPIIDAWFNHAKNNNLDDFFNATVPWFFTSNTFQTKRYILENAKVRYGRLDFEAVARLCHSFLSANLTNQLPEIKAPTCIIGGEQDLLIERAYTDILHKNIPTNELHIIPFSGHVVCWERMEEFNTVLLGFLSKHAT